jgi:predicted peptidase
MNAMAAADDDEPPRAEEIYAAKIFRHEDQTLPYRFLKPEHIEAGRKYPLVLFLHGAGERGNDNRKQLVHALPEFIKRQNRARFPCFVVAPQCPTERRWVEVDWTLQRHEMPEEMSVPLGLTWELLQQVTEQYPIDQDRIYITGLSMGGYGAWDLIQRKPDYFAAALPVCGGADEKYAERLINLPIWTFHGDKDAVVPLVRSTRMVETIEKAGGKPKLTIYPGVGHDSWTATYANPEVLEWLFSQKK